MPRVTIAGLIAAQIDRDKRQSARADLTGELRRIAAEMGNASSLSSSRVAICCSLLELLA
jgi:hypothetical protein